MNIEMFNINNDDKYLKKKRKKRKHITICTSNCKYNVVRRIAAQCDMKEVTEDSSWNLYWTDLSISIERAKEMKRFQKVNHFPGMTEICRKDLLARNLNRMLRLFPKEYNFFPKTWCLPTDYGEAVTYAKMRRSKTFIIKPETGCQGRGIYLTKTLKDIKPYDRMICQVYLTKPFLIDGFKFDLRIYVLITSCDPLRIYVYNDGLVRFATSRYKEPTCHNTSNVFMHLTNYSVNKHSRMFITDEEAGSKRKISTFNKWLINNNIDANELWRKIDEIIVKTILAAYPILKHNYHTCFPTHNLIYACFEILGFDIIIDWKLKPFLLEVNHSPSFHTDAKIDKDIKESLLIDTFTMLNFHQCDKKKILEEDRKRIRNRLLQGINTKDTTINDSVGLIKPLDNYFQEQYRWEDEHMGNFRRIYPCTDDNKYNLFFKQSSNSMFQNTAASRAREEASKIQRDEAAIVKNTKNKLKEEESKRTIGKWLDPKVQITSESPNGSHKINSISLPRNKNKITNQLNKSGQSEKLQLNSSTFNILSSFKSEIINESDERERIASMTKRDFLIKNHGILEQVYLIMKKNGTLRQTDIKKYGFYDNKSNNCELQQNPPVIEHKLRKIEKTLNIKSNNITIGKIN